MMNSKEIDSKQIQDMVFKWAKSKQFSAPYGVLTGEHINKKGKKFLSVVFGRARTLDVCVEIYNRNFMLVKTNRNYPEIFKNVEDLKSYLETL